MCDSDIKVLMGYTEISAVHICLVGSVFNRKNVDKNCCCCWFPLTLPPSHLERKNPRVKIGNAGVLLNSTGIKMASGFISCSVLGQSRGVCVCVCEDK